VALGDVIARLSVVLGLDTAAFEAGSTLAQKQTAKLQKELQKTGDKIVGVGKTLSIGLTVPLTAFGVKAFDAASDAAELQSAFDQTFSGMTKEMNAWAVATGDAMGRSTQTLQTAANTFGIFFNTAVPKAKAAEMSKTFSQLALDLGSFYNIKPGDAIAKLQSGLAGESEPLRAFGVSMTEAAVNAKALELGLVGVGDKLTEQQKIQARYALILDQTKNAQGDLARTSGGTANQIEASKAAFEELSIVVGTKLLPVITPLITKIAEALNWFTSLPGPVQTVAVAFGAFLAVVGPLVVAFGTLLPFLLPIASGIGAVGGALLLIAANPVILGLAAVITGIYLAWKNWDQITAIVKSVYDAVKTWIIDKLQAALDLGKAAINLYIQAWTVLPGKILAIAQALVTGVENWISKKLGAIFDGAMQKTVALGDAFRSLYDKVVGHSYVPDMVAEIGLQFAKLQPTMVNPALAATQAVGDAFKAQTDTVIAQNDLSVRSTEDMVKSTFQAFEGLVQSIKGGGFFDILGSLLGFGVELAKAGTFGKSASNFFNTVPHLAGGTRYHAGGMALVGERGPELVSMPRGSKVTPNADLGGRGMAIQVIPSPYFDVRVSEVSTPIAQASGMSAVGMAERRSIKQGQRRLGR
jgi:hypothetical protein